MSREERVISSIVEVASDARDLVKLTGSLWALCKQYGCHIDAAVTALRMGLDIVDVVEVMQQVHEQGLPGGGDKPYQVAFQLALIAKVRAGHAPTREVEDIGIVSGPPPVHQAVVQPPPQPQPSAPSQPAGLSFRRN